MNKIMNFEKYNFKITWTLLYLGFKSNTIFRDYLSSNEIIMYAIQQLENNDNDELVFELASEYESNTSKISELLYKLSNKEKVDINIELRKWRLLIIVENMPIKNENVINGLMDLNDLWIKLKYPKDSPHIFQGINNDITPQLYYTEENYNQLYKKHIEWIQDEIEFINKNQA